MKGQFVFEFLIAGIIFFAVVIYSINYLSVSVYDYKGKFYQNRLQNKAIQISEVLISGKSPLSIAEDSELILSKIQAFDNMYCSGGGDYPRLVKELYLYEITRYDIFPLIHNDVKINIFNSTDVLLDCGPLPGSPRAEIERVALVEGNVAKLRVIVW